MAIIGMTIHRAGIPTDFVIMRLWNDDENRRGMVEVEIFGYSGQTISISLDSVVEFYHGGRFEACFFCREPDSSSDQVITGR